MEFSSCVDELAVGVGVWVGGGGDWVGCAEVPVIGVGEVVEFEFVSATFKAGLNAKLSFRTTPKWLLDAWAVMSKLSAPVEMPVICHDATAVPVGMFEMT